jgi:hypothetical protein
MDDLKILVIEDDKYISNFIEVSLRKSGYEVLVGESAAAGLFLYSSHKPDIILLDLGLPDRDGIEIIRELRETSEIPSSSYPPGGWSGKRSRRWIWAPTTISRSPSTWENSRRASAWWSGPSPGSPGMRRNSFTATG